MVSAEPLPLLITIQALSTEQFVHSTTWPSIQCGGPQSQRSETIPGEYLLSGSGATRH
jgi:hypothetical protein